jgi:hypothetical protein
MSSHSSSFSNPVRARGIMVEPAVPMSPTPSICVHLPKPLGSSLKITSIALTRSKNGAKLACLSKSSVYVYTLNAEGSTAGIEREVQLPVHDDGWSGVAIADNFLAAWGFSGRKKIVGPTKSNLRSGLTIASTAAFL